MNFILKLLMHRTFLNRRVKWVCIVIIEHRYQSFDNHLEDKPPVGTPICRSLKLSLFKWQCHSKTEVQFWNVSKFQVSAIWIVTVFEVLNLNHFFSPIHCRRRGLSIYRTWTSSLNLIATWRATRSPPWHPPEKTGCLVLSRLQTLG